MKKIIYGVLIVSVLSFGVVHGAAQEESAEIKKYKQQIKDADEERKTELERRITMANEEIDKAQKEINEKKKNPPPKTAKFEWGKTSPEQRQESAQEVLKTCNEEHKNLITKTPEEIAAQATYMQAQAEYNLASKNLLPAQQQYADKSIPPEIRQQNMEKALQNLNQAQEKEEQAKQYWELLKKNKSKTPSTTPTPTPSTPTPSTPVETEQPSVQPTPATQQPEPVKKTYEEKYKLIAEEKAAREEAELIRKQLEQNPIYSHNQRTHQYGGKYQDEPQELIILKRQYDIANEKVSQKSMQLYDARQKENQQWHRAKLNLLHPRTGTTYTQLQKAQQSKKEELPTINILQLKYNLEVADYYIKRSNPSPLLEEFEIEMQLGDINRSITDIQNALNKIIL